MAVTDRIVIEIAAEYSDNTAGEFQKSAKSADKYCESVNKLKKQLDSISKTKVRTDLEARDSATQVINKVRDNLDYLKQHKGQVTIAAIDKATNVISETKNRVLALSGKTFRFTLGVIDKATAPLQKIWNYATSLKGIMTGIFAGAAAQKFVMKPAQMAIDRQNVTTAFENLLGSKDAANQRVSDLTTFAGQTPFTRDDIFEASRVLQVFTGDALSTADGLKTVGDVASGTQQDFKEVAVWMGRLYSGMKSGQPIGEATARLQEMGAISGESRVKLEALAKSGRDISETWPEATAEFAQFDGMMLKMSDGFQNLLLGAKSFVNNNVWQRIGAGIINGFTPALQKFRDWRSENKDLIAEMANNIESGVTNIVSKVSGGVEKVFDITSKLMKDDTFKNADFMGKAGMLWDQLIAEPFSSWWNGGGKDKVKEGVKNAANGIKDILIDVLGEAFELAFSNPITGTIATLYGAKYGISIGKGLITGVNTAKGAVIELENVYKKAKKIYGLLRGTEAIPELPYGTAGNAESTVVSGTLDSASSVKNHIVKSAPANLPYGVVGNNYKLQTPTIATLRHEPEVKKAAENYRNAVETLSQTKKRFSEEQKELVQKANDLKDLKTSNAGSKAIKDAEKALDNNIKHIKKSSANLKNTKDELKTAKEAFSGALDSASSIDISNASKKMKGSMNDVTKSTKNMGKEVAKAGKVASDGIGNVAKAAGSSGGKIASLVNSLGGATTVLTGIGTVAVVAAAGFALYKHNVEKSVAPIKDLLEKNQQLVSESDKLNERVAQNTKSREDSISASVAEAQTAQVLTDKIFGLIDAEGESLTGKEKIKILVDELNQTVPNLALAYDAETNSINLSKDAINEKIAAMKEEAKMAAIKDALTGSVKDELELERKHTKLVEQQAEAQKKVDEIKSKIKPSGMAGAGTSDEYNYIALDKAQESLDELNTAIEGNETAWNNAKNESQYYSDMIGTEATAAAQNAIDATQSGIEGTVETLTAGGEDISLAASSAFTPAEEAALRAADKMYSESHRAAANYAAGLNEGGPEASKAGNTLRLSGMAGISDTNGEYYKEGESSGNSFVDGIKSALSGAGSWFKKNFSWLFPEIDGESKTDHHADGGIMTRPHIGLVAEDGAESIIPLSPKRRSRGIALWQETGRRLGVMAYAEGGIVGQAESYPMAAGGSYAYTSSGSGGPSVSGGGGETGRMISFETGGLKEDLAEADQYFQEYSSNVLTAGLSTWDSLKNNVTSKTQEMNDADKAKFDEFAQYFTTFGTGVVLAGAAAFDALKGGVVTKSTDTVKFGISKFNEFSNYVGTLPPVFGGYGADMMSELAYGIESQRAAVLKSTSTLVQDLLSTFITGLGIHSPSKKMQWVGEMMAAGIIKGLSADQITQYVYYIIDQMQSSFSSGKLDVGTVVDKLDDNIPALVAKLGVDPKEAASLIYPLLGTAGTLTSVFGGRDAPTAGASTNHGGIDLAAPTGTQIAAVLGGLVTIAGEYGGYGNAVKIDHGNGVESLYGHMSAVGVAPGQQVTAGQVIGNVGSTGISTGPHLHLSMYKDGEAIDPLPYVQGAPIMAGNTLAGALMAEYNRRKFGIGAAGALGGGGDVASWIMQALAITGQSMDYLDELMYIAQMESGGDPNAINLWDSNAAAGHPSKGLMQTIDSTFAAYALPGYDDIWNPVHNAIAAIRYMNERYGGIQNHPGLGGKGYIGYAVGTREVPQDMLAVIHKDEAIFPAAQNPFSKSGGDMIADMVSKVLPFPEMESNSIRNEKDDFAERNNVIEFPERKSDSGQPASVEAVPVVASQNAAPGGMTVSINLGGISISIDGSNAGTPQDIEALLRAQIPGIANDLCAQIAQKLTEILAGMPTRSEAV